MKAAWLCALLGTALVATASNGWAFCRATTCDPSTEVCERDSSLCLTTGTPLFWASSCVQVYMQANGAPSQGISFETAKDSLTRAFDTWLAADCGSGPPMIDVQVLGPITCDTAEYNATQKNANIVMFREDDWPYIGAEDTLGFTELHFDANTGELWDADLEINAVTNRFSVGEPVTDNDLDSMLTHEAGHMLGLAHTLVQDATMFATYTPGTDGLRTLADDDVQGICATYPPDRVPSRTSCSPRHGFSDECAVDQPANDATSEGTDQDDPESASVSKGCAFSTPTRSLSWLEQFAALGFVLGFARSRRVCRAARKRILLRK
jgi:hypothetical protein